MLVTFLLYAIFTTVFPDCLGQSHQDPGYSYLCANQCTWQCSGDWGLEPGSWALLPACCLTQKFCLQKRFLIKSAMKKACAMFPIEPGVVLPVGAGDFLPMDIGTMLPVAALLCSPGALTVTCSRHWERRWRNRLGRLAGRNQSLVACACGRENQSLPPLGLEQEVDGLL